MNVRNTLLATLALCLPCLGAPLIGSTWTLVSLRTGGVMLFPQANERYTVTLEDSGRASGVVNCNSCGGSYTLTGDTLTVSMLFCTDMACRLSEIEGPYNTTIANGARYELTGDTLRLFGADTLVFAAPPAGIRAARAVGPRPAVTRRVVSGSGQLLVAARANAWYDCRGRKTHPRQPSAGSACGL
jgi:heat shock protein HslJ